MAGIVRKQDTGETGNQGEFGTISSGDADITIIDEPAQVRRESDDEGSGPSLRVPTLDHIPGTDEFMMRTAPGYGFGG